MIPHIILNDAIGNRLSFALFVKIHCFSIISNFRGRHSLLTTVRHYLICAGCKKLSILLFQDSSLVPYIGIGNCENIPF